MNYFFECLIKYFDFSGRARRKEYWFFILFYYLFYFLSWLLDNLLNFNFTGTEVGFLTLSYILLMIIPNLSVTVRRLHDINKSGLMIFIIFIPLIGWIWLLALTLIEGDKRQNQYGPAPKYSQE